MLYPIFHQIVSWWELGIVAVGILIGKEISKPKVEQVPMVEPPIEIDPLTKEQLKQHLEKFQEQIDPLLDLGRANQIAIEAQKHDSIEMLLIGTGIALILGVGFGLTLYYLKKK